MMYEEHVGVFKKCSPTVYFCIAPQRLGRSPYFRRLPAWSLVNRSPKGCVAMMAGEEPHSHTERDRKPGPGANAGDTHTPWARVRRLGSLHRSDQAERHKPHQGLTKHLEMRLKNLPATHRMATRGHMRDEDSSGYWRWGTIRYWSAGRVSTFINLPLLGTDDHHLRPSRLVRKRLANSDEPASPLGLSPAVVVAMKQLL